MDDLALDDRSTTDRRPYEVRLREVVGDAAVFRIVFVRVLLILSGYDGPFIDATQPWG